VHVVDRRIDMCIFLSSTAALPPRKWLAGLFEQPMLDDLDRTGLLLGLPAEPGIDTGRTICSCYGVGSNTICDAIRDKNLDSVAQVTACLKAGGNCGSCVPEIKKLLTETRLAIQA
jgi:assimilatory nitrate reductase catalytic subunit